jgi:prepilin-type N-terminal cleavage/methylation domain-containing protein
VSARTAQARRGMSLIELLVAITLLGLVMASATNYFIAQSRMFQRGQSDMNALQNVRIAADLLQQHFRTTGSNLALGQPPIVLADTSVFAFNADYATNTDSDLTAVYVQPDLQDNYVLALSAANQITIPGSSPAVVYPDSDYLYSPGQPSRAETITFYFEKDTTTARSDDYVMFRQVNDQLPEAIVRNILPDTVPFFRYKYLQKNSDGVDSLAYARADSLPLRFNPLNDQALVDSLRIVEVHFLITNGDSGSAERKHRLSLIAPLPNMGKRRLSTCGDIPVFGQTVTASLIGADVTLTWNAATDEFSAEKDILSYVIYRRLVGAAGWGSPHATIPAGSPNYSWADRGVASGTWEYGVAAQDCTPSMSGVTVSNQVNVP